MPMHEGGTEAAKVTYLIGRSAGTNAVIAGFIATVIATVSGLWFPGVRLPQFDFNTLNGYLALGCSALFLSPACSNPTNTFLLGGIIHVIDGIIFGIIFGLIIYPALGLLKPLRPMTPTVNLTKGIIWGGALWIISSALWMPLLIGGLIGNFLTTPFPGGFGLSCGVGPFLTCFGPYGWQALWTNLLWHMIWGVNLGLLFSPTLAKPGTMSAGASTASGAGVR